MAKLLDVKSLELHGYIESLMNHFLKNRHTDLALGVYLSSQECKIINFIGRKKSCIMREISKFISLAVSSTTSSVDKLVKKGLVVRHRSEEDRRIVLVELTKEGQEAYKKDRDHLLELSRGILNTLEEEEQNQLLNLMEKVQDSFPE